MKLIRTALRDFLIKLEELAKIIPIATKVKPEPPKKEEPPPKVSTAKGKKAEPPKRPSRSGFTGEEKSGSS